MCLLGRTPRTKNKGKDKSGVEHLERIKHGSGIKDRDDKSSGIEILMTESFTKFKPNDPFKLANKQREENEIDPIPPVIHYPGPMLHGECVKIVND